MHRCLAVVIRMINEERDEGKVREQIDFGLTQLVCFRIGCYARSK